MHILLIEDDLDLGRALQPALKVEGLTSEWLRRAVDAPATVDATTIDCVLLDLTLPDGEGLDALRQIRSAAHAIPVVVLSGRDDERLAVDAVHDGAQDYLLKGEVEGRLLCITGGNYELCQGAEEFCACGGCPRHRRRRERMQQAGLLDNNGNERGTLDE